MDIPPFQRIVGDKAVLKLEKVFLGGLIAVGESCRRAFDESQSDIQTRHAAYQKLRRIIEKYRPAARQDDGKVGEILDRYSRIAIQRAIDFQEVDFLQGLKCTGLSEKPKSRGLLKVISNQKKTESLYLLCIVPAEFLETELEVALPLAAEQGWDEAVLCLLSHGAVVNSQHEKGRTALSYYCATRGSISMVKALLDSGAHPDLVDK